MSLRKKNISSDGKIQIYLKEFTLKIGIIFIFIAIIAWPWSYNVQKEESKNWIDIVLILDISKSMLAEDIKPSRIEVAKKIIIDFISKFQQDRIWMTIFAWKPFVSIPLTFDYSAIKTIVKSLTTDTINQNVPWLSWTAIWDWIILASDSLTKASSGKNRSKVIILVTDWEANMWIDPKLASKYAADKNIKIYAVWIWDINWTELYITDEFWNKQYFLDNTWKPINATLDIKTLDFITKTTWWKYYLANNEESLKDIFTDLWNLNKTEIKDKIVRNFDYDIEEHLNVLVLLLILLLILNIKYKFE